MKFVMGVLIQAVDNPVSGPLFLDDRAVQERRVSAPELKALGPVSTLNDIMLSCSPPSLPGKFSTYAVDPLNRPQCSTV